MRISVLDLYTIGIGPSSSHTVGPMRAAVRFIKSLPETPCERASVRLFGSLAHTGKGHGTHRAIVAGLHGHLPETVDPEEMPLLYENTLIAKHVPIGGGRRLPFDLKKDLVFDRKRLLPHHPNGMTFQAFAPDGGICHELTVYSVGGGFIVSDADLSAVPAAMVSVPWPFHSAEDLLRQAEKSGGCISRMVAENETSWRSERAVRQQLDTIWEAMQACIEKGLTTRGTLPGGLNVQRRAPEIHASLCDRPETALRDNLAILDWVNLYAMAVNEENAAGGRVVTAPTNGAAGVIPAVMRYCERFLNPAKPTWHRDFLLTAGAIGALYKENASISGADVGCQGEVGVACSMAAGGLAEVMGGSPQQVENAAEIGMEHNLGLTCDPVGGLVQVPCIERNAMGAVKAINAARLALRGDGRHTVSLDAVIRTMRQTGKDMRSKYKETSRGGLAVNVVEC
jgi:L-serine dehydratase